MARKPTLIYCPCCKTEQPISHFYPAYGRQWQETVPLCIDCCDAKLKEYSEIVGEPSALYTVLGEIGIPYIRDVYQEVVDSRNRGGSKPKVVGAYIKRLQRYSTIYNGFWDSDVELSELMKREARDRREGSMDMNEMQRIWGKFQLEEMNEAYEFLEQTFIDYTSDIELDANLEKRYRDLCKAEYRLRKAYESGDTQEISKAQANLQSLLKLLKLDNFQANEKDEREKFIDRLAWMIEQTEPAEEEDREKYRDIAGFEQAFKNIMRSMRNLIAGTKEYPDIPREER